MKTALIEQHGVIGNMRSAALVSTEGEIDFYCLPNFDSPSVFAALLDPHKGGSFRIEPADGKWRTKQLYLPDTNILVTRFMSDDGLAEITDLMPVVDGALEPPNRILRNLKVIKGQIQFRLRCAPRFDYARCEHTASIEDMEAVFRAAGRGVGVMTLFATVPLRAKDGDAVAEFTLARGEQATFSFGAAGEGDHPVWGWLALGAVMTLLFVSIFQFAQAPMDWIANGNAALANWIKRQMPEGDLRNLLTDGVIGGVGTIVMFLPQILILFFFIGLLESTGYMARAAFIMDRLMSRVGLNGKSFIPLLSSYACAIPGIMATRTIEDPKDRLVTILVAPLMSCSARLPVYLMMIAALLPGSSVSLAAKVGIMVLMYALGTLGAFGFAWLFKRTLLRGKPPLMIMELPPYRLPRLRDVFLHMVERAGLFLKNAGTIILAISVVLWFLAAYPKAPAGANATQQLAQSFAGRAGHAIEPLIKPIGFDWQIGIGLISSFAAREVFVSTMGVVFNAEAEG